MTRSQMNDLLTGYAGSASENLYEYEYDLYMFFYGIYRDTPFRDIPDTAFMFMETDGWQGMSGRCGVWQYYESGAFDKGRLERAAAYLKADGEEEWADIFASGIHDYAAQEYQAEDNAVPYPDEWIDGSEKIDNWIYANELYINEWKRRLILTHKDELLKLAEDNKGESEL